MLLALFQANTVNCTSSYSLLKSDRKSQHIGLLRLGTVVCLADLMYTVTIVSIALATLTAHSYGEGEVRTNMAWTSGYLHGLVDEVSVCTHILGQSIFGEKLLAIDILRREQKEQHSVIVL